MKTAMLLILMTAVSSCTANVDSTLVGMFSTMVENAEKEVALASGETEFETEREDFAEEEQISKAPVDQSAAEVFSELRAISEARSQIEQSQSDLSTTELSELRDSHAERMSKKISDAGLSAGGN